MMPRGATSVSRDAIAIREKVVRLREAVRGDAAYAHVVERCDCAVQLLDALEAAANANEPREKLQRVADELLEVLTDVKRSVSDRAQVSDVSELEMRVAVERLHL